jgi:hypothetical protein
MPTIETNVNIFAEPQLSKEIVSVLTGMPFNYFICSGVSDVCMIPSFINILDGYCIKKDNKDIDTWECFISNWSGKREKCFKCRQYAECNKEIPPEDAYLFSSPEYNAPAILFNADKREREVQGLVSLIPPMPVTQPFSRELKEWIKSTCLQYHKKAIRWGDKYDQWDAIQREKDLAKPKSFAEIAEMRWMSRNIKIEITGPEFD